MASPVRVGIPLVELEIQHSLLSPLYQRLYAFAESRIRGPTPPKHTPKGYVGQCVPSNPAFPPDCQRVRGALCHVFGSCGVFDSIRYTRTLGPNALLGLTYGIRRLTPCARPGEMVATQKCRCSQCPCAMTNGPKIWPRAHRSWVYWKGDEISFFATQGDTKRT